jgi:hypothetical protein
MQEYLNSPRQTSNRIDYLLDFCTEICDQSENDRLLTGIKNYRLIHDRLKEEDEAECFLRVYEKNKTQILKGFRNSKWLCNNDFNCVYFGKGKANINLREIYDSCCILGSSNEEGLSKFPIVSEEKMYTKYLAEIFLFLLYSVFEGFVEVSEEKRILEDNMQKVKSYVSTDGKDDNTSIPEATSMFSNLLGPGSELSGLIGNVMGELKKSGIIKDNQQEMFETKISSVISSLQKGDYGSIISEIQPLFSRPQGDKEEDEAPPLRITNKSENKTEEVFDVEDIE